VSTLRGSEKLKKLELTACEVSVQHPRGPFRLIELDFWVRDARSGVFILLNAEKVTTKIGFSETDLKTAIAEATDCDTKWFKFTYALSPARLRFLTASYALKEAQSQLDEHSADREGAGQSCETIVH
jgi:hypothetical protein